jgi:hypothetical protein
MAKGIVASGTRTKALENQETALRRIDKAIRKNPLLCSKRVNTFICNLSGDTGISAIQLKSLIKAAIEKAVAEIY